MGKRREKMKKKKRIIDISCCLCAILIVVTIIFLVKNKEKTQVENSYESKWTDITQVKKQLPSDIQALKDGKYENLIVNTNYEYPLYASIESIDGVYNIEIHTNTTYRNRTYIENFAMMNEVIDKFFMEEFDKSYLVADLYLSENEIVDINYNDIEQIISDKQYQTVSYGSLFGQYNIEEGKYMVQIEPSLNNVWFSKVGMGDIQFSYSEDGFKEVYPYLSCIRQREDTTIHLLDGDIKLSEMEERVLDYLNGEAFPLPKSETIRFGIADVRILENGEYEGICFKVRRIYKGIPFEYGSNAGHGIYVDEVENDKGELSYAISTSPDTMLSFGRVNGTVVETKDITEMISAGNAIDILSEEIGENSIYDVYGVELVYRECEILEEQQEELDAVLTPKWKVITRNQNDDKYTFFYIDVLTGEVTERFEYYYE